ncbi:MAG: hypothetical protein R3F16_25100 [Myxococcota bacterium]
MHRRTRFVLLLVAMVLSGCATSSPFNQTFVEVRTTHFVLTSSLGEDASLVLARDLETFHTALVATLDLGSALADRPPSHVFAFDGRSVDRPFSIAGEPAYVLPTVDDAIFVFRSGGDFAHRATADLRHDYAHRVLRDALPVPAPLWLEEGLAQLAGSITVHGGAAFVGDYVPELRQIVLDWRVEDLTEGFWREDLLDRSPAERRRFEARAWAVAHSLLFGQSPGHAADGSWARIRGALLRGDRAALDRGIDAIGLDDPAFSPGVYAHLERRKLAVRRMSLEGFRRDAVAVVALAPEEARTRLAELAVELGKPQLARGYYERALEADPGFARARAGLALVDAMEGRLAGLEAALEGGGADTGTHLVLAEACRLAGLAASQPARRTAWLDRAREAAATSLVLDPASARARLTMAATHLVSEEDPARAAEWLASARALRRGALEIGLWQARLEAATGGVRAAAVAARELGSRSHWTPFVRRAEAFAEAAGAGERFPAFDATGR